MKIKEAARLCGVTEKAIRLYEEKGLIHPRLTEQNGRCFRDYDAETIRELQTVAGLRQSFFSMEQISVLQNEPERISAVYDAYREELHTQYDRLSALIARADALDGSTFSDAETLAAALTGNTGLLRRTELPVGSDGGSDGIFAASASFNAAAASVSASPAAVSSAETFSAAERNGMTEDACRPYYTDAARDNPPPPPEMHFRVWDEELRGDARQHAYARAREYTERWGARYDAVLFLDRLRKPLLWGIAGLLLVVLILQIPFAFPVREQRTAYCIVCMQTEGGHTAIREIMEEEASLSGRRTKTLLSSGRRFRGNLFVTETEGDLLPEGWDGGGTVPVRIFGGGNTPIWERSAAVVQTPDGKRALVLSEPGLEERGHPYPSGVFCLHPFLSKTNLYGEKWIVIGAGDREAAQAWFEEQIIGVVIP